MTRYTIFADISSSRDADLIERYLIKAMEKAEININSIKINAKATTGRKAINRPKIERWLLHYKIGSIIELEAAQVENDLSEAATRKAFRGLVDDDFLKRSYMPGGGLQYTLLKHPGTQ